MSCDTVVRGPKLVRKNRQVMTADPYKSEWPFLGFENRSRTSKFAGGIVKILVFSITKFWTAWPMNTTVVHNGHHLTNIIENRLKYQREHGKPARPLLTLSNHQSCLDDPLMWGKLIKMRYIFRDHLRWVPTAAEICFTNPFTSFIFGEGNCVPVVRGAGVYQQGLDLCINRLNDNRWVHFFPEGKINLVDDKRLKWGVGRAIAESTQIPDIVPIWLIGMDNILPNRRPYIPLIRQVVHVYVGEPISIESQVEEIKRRLTDPMDIRKNITDIIQHHFWKVQEEAAEKYLEYSKHHVS